MSRQFRKRIREQEEDEDRHRRGKRSLNEENVFDMSHDDPSWWNNSVANYSVSAFGQNFLLHLTPFDAFLAPNYTFHFMGDEKREMKGSHFGVPRHCFYSGHVGDNKNHKAVVSICSGLVSYCLISLLYYVFEIVIIYSFFIDIGARYDQCIILVFSQILLTAYY